MVRGKPGTRKAKIPKALREQVWRTHCGQNYQGKCFVTWCTNQINVFDFEVGHNIPESKGGTLALTNLRPLCGRCNMSMGNQYTIDQWITQGAQNPLVVQKHGLTTSNVTTNEVPVVCCGCW
jgi:5-methylcytosine-specific restriction endonuclease McrA